jgi:transposase InsO family protein
MPWKVSAVSEMRVALCHAVRVCRVPVSAAARDFGVSRKTAHKWLAAYDAAGREGVAPLAAMADRSRRPLRSPGKTAEAVERAVLAVRDRFNWGPRKIRAFLANNAPARDGAAVSLGPIGNESGAIGIDPWPRAADLPSARTCSAILRRHGRLAPPPPPPPPPPQRFQRPQPNLLWQVDFKSAVEVARRKLMPLAVIDDCSRYLLAFEPCPNLTMATAWAVLWEVFAAAGLPEQVLADNGFGSMTANPVGVSWFDSRLIRAGIRPSHGRPYHPQTQGKVERLNGTSRRELLDFDARRTCPDLFAQDCRRWRGVYNTIRPHEALGDATPASLWSPSPRKRPQTLPDPESFYPAGSTLRKVDQNGHVSFHGYTILTGKGIIGDRCRVEDRGGEIAVFYCWKQFRALSTDQLIKGRVL